MSYNIKYIIASYAERIEPFDMNYIAAERLRALREDNDYTQREIAALLRCSQVSYSHYEIGRRDIPLEHLVTLAEFYGVSVDYILGITDSKQRYPETAGSKG